jgi:ketosteroid isomerase-like protein
MHLRHQPGRIDVHAEQEAEFQELMDAWSEAIVADDPEAIGGFAEPDWMLIGENGPFPRNRFLEAVRNGRITHHTMSHEIHSIRLYGDVAVLLTRGRNTGAYDGQEYELDEWTTDVFVHRRDGWKCIVTHLTNASDPTLQGPEEDAAVR